MLELPNVTLVAVNTVCHQLSDMAVAECISKVNFGDIKVFTNRNGILGSIEIPSFANLQEAGEFTVYELPKFIKTSHALFIHWDSWIIDTAMWSDSFLKYDYIGAPWWYTDGYNVGNSGFCLRSKALLDFMANNRDTFPLQMPEDFCLCRQYRKMLPQFTWAPESVASNFSFERTRQSIDSKHFGFHGMFNWPFVLPPDRLAERMAIARNDPYVQKSKDIKELDGLGDSRWFKVGSKIVIGKGV